MRLTWFPRVSRHSQFCVVGLVLALGFLLVRVTSAVTQQTPPKPTLTFQNDAGVIILYVKAEKTADFEELMSKFKEGLGKLDIPEAKQQATGLKLFRGPSGGGTAVYLIIADPAVKNVEYWFLSILYKAFPNDTQALYQKWVDAKAATPTATFDLTLVTKMQ